MSMYLEATVMTPNGRKEYVVRELAGEFYTDGEIGPDDFRSAGDEFEAEDWGTGKHGPYADVVLRRTSAGWVEVRRTEI